MNKKTRTTGERLSSTSSKTERQPISSKNVAEILSAISPDALIGISPEVSDFKRHQRETRPRLKDFFDEDTDR